MPSAYLAAEGFEAQLLAELGTAAGEVQGRLILSPAPARPSVWAQNVWEDPRRLTFQSIREAADLLRGMQRNWALWPVAQHRRAHLIAERLPHVSARPLTFPDLPPAAPLGSWCLLDANTLLAAPTCRSPFRHGEVVFHENREAPPNRAYLKLWETLTRLGRHPGPGERCLDLGASPGGWTWVLHELGAQVISVDKAALDPAIAALPRVQHRQESAFGLRPQDIGPVDWLTSDVICYPERLLRLVETWLTSGLVANFVCTLKFQGPTDHAAIAALAAIPGGQVVHLFHNKHEVTWMWPAPTAGSSAVLTHPDPAQISRFPE